jgi:pyridoxal phosphate enzyme (YggS family)
MEAMGVRENLDRVRERVARACAACGRAVEEVTLVAVTKTVPAWVVREAYDAGHRHFGEVRLQEALPKIAKLPPDAMWHFVGALQSNKAKAAARAFSAVHTLESEGQLREIAKSGAQVDGLIEVNIAQEPQKSGISPEDLDAAIQMVLKYELVRLRGLMTVGPFLGQPEAMRPYFRRLRDLAERAGVGEWLSMGMSNDLEVAIQEGSTHVRVGTAIFGERT